MGRKNFWGILVFSPINVSFSRYKYFEEEKIFGHRKPFTNRCFLFVCSFGYDVGLCDIWLALADKKLLPITRCKRLTSKSFGLLLQRKRYL